MVYWGLDDVLAIGILILAGISVYVSFDIRRVTDGSPRAWDLFIVAFVVLFLYRVVQLVFDLQSPQGTIDNWEALISLIANALLLGGLTMLDLTFRRHLKALQSGR